MNVARNLGLLARINLVVAGLLLTFFGLFAYASYLYQRELLQQEAIAKARLVAAAAIRTREYLSDELQRGGVPLSADRRGLIPVLASNRIGALVGADVGYRIRQVSLRFRNPANAPDPYETAALRRLQEQQAGEEFSFEELEGEPVFRYLQPFTAEPSCLECHGDPALAPGFIQELYPAERDQAYHYRIGEVIGAASVTIPMAQLSERFSGNLRRALVFGGGMFLALVVCLGLLLRYAVTVPLGRLGRAMRDIVLTGRFDQELPVPRQDEIGLLTGSFNNMIATLREKTEGLEESERRYRILTDTARDGIVSFLANGQIILFNREAERMFAYSKREILGEPVARLIHADCEAFHRQGAEAFLAGHAERLLAEVHRIPVLRRDGSRFEVELSLSWGESDGYRFYTALLREQR